MTILDDLVIRISAPTAGIKVAAGEVDKLEKEIAQAESKAKQFQKSLNALMTQGPLTASQASRASQIRNLIGVNQARAQQGQAVLGQASLYAQAAPEEKAATGFDMLKRAAQGLLALQVVSWARNAGAHLLDLASNTEETQGALKRAFGAEGQADIESWASSTADGLARSQYQLREFAGQLGAMLTPMLGSKDAAREMSKSLTTLAVDFGAAFNTTDEEALTALRSGLAGESEPLKKYGVILLDNTLKEYAHTQGIKKKFEAMNIAEKTQLRYNYIMSIGANSIGAATSEAAGYAGRQRAAAAAVRELSTNIGLFFLPVATRMLDIGGKLLNWMVQFQKHSSIMQVLLYGGLIAGFIKLAAVLTSVVQSGAALRALMAVGPWMAWAIGIAVVIGFVEDLWTMFAGGKSVIGLLIDKTFGLGAVDSLIRSIAAGIKIIQELGFFGAIKEAVGGVGDMLTQTRDYGARQEAERLAASTDPNERALGERSLAALGNRGKTSAAPPKISRALGIGLGADAQDVKVGQGGIGLLGGTKGDVNNVNVAVNVSEGVIDKSTVRNLSTQVGQAAAGALRKEIKNARDTLAPNRGGAK